MQIGFDVTVLYVAQAGVFSYRYNLIRAMLQQDSPENDFYLLDYYPVHGGWRDQPEIETVLGDCAEFRRVTGLRHRKLSRLSVMQNPGLSVFAQNVDKIVLYPYARLVESIMYRQLQNHLPDLDVFHSSDVLCYAPNEAKSVVTIHDMTTVLFPEYHTPETREIQHSKLRFAKKQADAIIAVSKSTKEDVVNHLNLDPAKIHVVYEGVNSDFRPLPNEVVQEALAVWGLRSKEYMLHVGTIEPRKNLVRLVEAYHQLKQRAASTVPRLVLGGNAGWMFENVYARVRKLKLEDDILFAGHVPADKLPALINGALIFVYPSIYEGFGLPVLEALACGVPVITSNVSSMPEVVGDAALMVNPKDVSAIAAAIESLLENRERRNALAQAGLKQARFFSWDRAAKETLSVYRQIS